MQCKLTDQLRHALLAQTACSDETLHEFLSCEIDFLWDIQDDSCMCRLRYMYTLLGLIEAAQIFSRNKVDQMTKVAQSQSDELATSFSVLRGDAERDMSGRECTWSAATSQQFFARNSQDSSVSFSDGRMLGTSETKANGYDKSCRHTSGYGFHMSRVETGHFGNHSSQTITTNSSTSSTNGGTGPYFPTIGTEWVGTPLEAILPSGPSGTIIGTRPGPLYGEPAQPQSGQDLCPDPTPEFPEGACFANRYPSMGEGYSGRTAVDINLTTFLFSVRVSINWTEGLNWRQYMHCQSSATATNNTTVGGSVDTVTGFTRASEDDNQVYSSEQTDIAHLVRKYGIKIARSTNNTDAEEVSRGRANGLAHSESQRDKQAIGTSQQRSEAETKRFGESHSLRTENATSDQVSVKYSHIGTHLSKLWDRIWKEAMMLERQFAAVPAVATMDCLRGSTCHCIARKSWGCLGRSVPV